MVDWQMWNAQGRDVTIQTGGIPRRMRVHRTGGTGESVLLLHGYPASSLEFASVWPQLADLDVTAPDLLGFGGSDRLRPMDVMTQADAVEALLGDAHPVVVAGDLGALIVAELVARDPTRFAAVMLTNSTLSSARYRPRLIQRLACSPLGSVVDRALDITRFTASWGAVFGKDPLSPEMAEQHWMALNQGGRSRQRDLLASIQGRRDHGKRWEAAVDQLPAPRLLWGLADPVSGPEITHLSAMRPDAPMTVLDDVGHVVAMEAPKALAGELRLALSGIAPPPVTDPDRR